MPTVDNLLPDAEWIASQSHSAKVGRSVPADAENAVALLAPRCLKEKGAVPSRILICSLCRDGICGQSQSESNPKMQENTFTSSIAAREKSTRHGT